MQLWITYFFVCEYSEQLRTNNLESRFKRDERSHTILRFAQDDE